MLTFAVIFSILPELIPAMKPQLGYALSILMAGFGLFTLYLFWIEWQERNRYTFKPYKKRLAKHREKAMKGK